MKTSIDFIKHRSAFWRLFAFAAFLPMAAGAYTTGSASATYTCSLSGSGFTWHMGANSKENNGTGVFPTEVILLYCSYTSPSSVADLTIPGSLTWDSKGSAGTRLLPLTTIAAGAFRNCADIKTVTLPRSLKTVKLPCFKGCSNLSSINVSLAQVTDTYASENGVLFRNDKYQKTKLVKYPEGKTGSSYAVPSTVTNLADYCFANTKLSTIVFSGSPPPTVASTAFSGSSASVLYPQGASGWTSPWNGVNTYAIPNAVTGLKATQGTSQTQVTVTWTANAVAKSYVVYRAESTGGSKVTLGTIGSGSTVFSDTTATAGKTYYYWVKAVNGPAESGLGSYVQGWKAGSYTVTLDAQGGTGGTASVTATYGSSMPAIAVPSRPGYTFGGYYTSTGGGGTQYYTASGTSARAWDKAAAATLYAKWTGSSSTVTLDAQTGSGGTASVNATYGEAMPSIAVPTRTGYTFGGYYTGTNGGGTQYYTADGASARTWDKTAATTLYAKWTGNAYTVTLDAQSGSGGTASVTATCGEAMPSITVPTRTGYTFGGYYTATNGGGTQYYTAGGTSAHVWDLAAATTLYAQWTLEPTWSYTLSNGTATVTGVSPAEGELAIPATLGGCPVTAIGTNAFERCTNVTAVVIPGGVTNIGRRAFYGCNSLTSVTIPEGVETIGKYAFHVCYRLAEVMIPDSVSIIGMDAFSNCSGMTNLVLGSGVTTIGGYAFWCCSGLKKVSIPACVTSIGTGAFSAYQGQASIEVAAGNPAYASEDGILFDKAKTTLIQYPCLKGGEYVIPSSVKQIGSYAFYGCTGLTGATIPDSVESIGGYAFGYCSKLTVLSIPDSVTNIGNYVFYDCPGLTRLEVPGSWEGTDMLANAEVPEGCAIVYREWSKTVTAAFDANGGSCAVGSREFTVGEPYGELPEAVRPGYAFAGWWTAATGGTRVGADTVVEGTATLYARWSANTYAVTLDAQGGTNGTASVTATYGEAMPAIAVPAREGYAFGGYYTSADGAGTQYYTTDGVGVRAWDRTAATTLHAVWKPLAVATPVITPADGSVFVEETCEVSIGCATEGAAIYYTTDGTTPRIAEAFRYTAPFTLSGTATVKAVASVDGLKSGYAAATITRRILTLAEAAGAPNLAFTTGGIAEWKPVVDGLAGNGFAAQSGKIPPNEETWLEVSVSGPGTFRFDWKVDCEADDSGNATWDRLSASVDGGERLRIDGTTGWASVAFPLEGSGEHIIRWTFSKDGYDEEGAACSDRAWVSGVAWEPVDEPRTVAVAFDAHGGSCAPAGGEYTVGEPYGELPEAVRPGYTFAGWWTASAGGTRVGPDTVADAATTVLHARWTANTYVVTLDAQGGTGGTASVKVTYGNELPEIGVPSLAGCVFGGYYSRAGGTGTPYYGADGQGTRTWDVAGDATLYAKWTEITHTQSVAGVKWFYAVSDGTAKVTGANPAEGRLEIPSKLGGYPVTDIGDRAFAFCVELTGVGIPGSVTNIGSGAFDCCGLTEVTIPDSVKCIGDEAFYYCEEMTNVVIGAGVAVIGADAFEYCAALVAVTIPDGVTNLGARLFEGCRGLTSVTIGNGVKNIPDFAFDTCTALTNVVIGNSVTHIGHAAFAGCNGLEVLVVPCNVESVVGAFEYSLLKGLYVPAAWKGTDMLQNAMVPHGCAVLYTLSSTAFTIPAGGMTPVSVPYWNLGSADGSFKFGETGIAAGLPAGSAVYFWDEGKQKWGGGMKSAFGWDPAESNRVLLPGEGFCVRNGGAEAVEVAAVGEIPSDESLVRAYRGGGEWTFVAVPYPCGEDIQFGATELAMQLGKGASVMFWDASVQGWYTYSKSAKGWSSAGASRVLGEGEAFFVQSAPDDADGTWEAVKPCDYP